MFHCVPSSQYIDNIVGFTLVVNNRSCCVFHKRIVYIYVQFLVCTCHAYYMLIIHTHTLYTTVLTSGKGHD